MTTVTQGSFGRGFTSFQTGSYPDDAEILRRILRMSATRPLDEVMDEVVENGETLVLLKKIRAAMNRKEKRHHLAN